MRTLYIRLCSKCAIEMIHEGFDVERNKKSSEWSAQCSGCPTIEPSYRYEVKVSAGD